MIFKFTEFLLERSLRSLVPKSSSNAYEMVRKVSTSKSDYDSILNDMFNWWKGSFMLAPDSDSHVINAINNFRKVSTIYHKPVTGKLYRAVHMRVPGLFTKEEIMKITSAQLSNKKLQSWATSHDGAQYFYNHFCVKGNEDTDPVEEKAWVIVESDGKDLEQLITLEEAIQFIVDVDSSTIHNDQGFIGQLAFYLADTDLIKLHELICECKSPEPVFKVVDVLVLPKTHHK